MAQPPAQVGGSPLRAKLAKPIDLTKESPPPSPRTNEAAREIISISDGEDSASDDDLRRAIALSLQDQVKSASPVEGPESKEIAASPANPATTGTSSTPVPAQTASALGMLGLNRAQMEQDRLARLKRKREDGANVSTPTSVSPPRLRRARSRSPSKTATHKPTVPQTGQPATAYSHTPGSPLKYAHPTILRTTIAGQPSNAPDISLAALLTPLASLTSALLSSFTWSFDWLFPLFGPQLKRTNFLLVMSAKDLVQQQQLRRDFDGIANVKLCFPPMDGQVNCMHSKLQLLFFRDSELDVEWLRIVIPTGNLVPYDWGEEMDPGRGGVMENMVFVVDLPKISNVSSTEADAGAESERPAFCHSLREFLAAQKVPDEILAKLSQYDFSALHNVGFVHTIGGSHSSPAVWQSTGLCGLGRTISRLRLSTKADVKLHYVTSSVGSLNDEFMRSIYLAAQGDDGLVDYTLRTVKRPPPSISKESGSVWKDNFIFYFPSADTVARSRGGPNKAGTICFQSRWWDGHKFPKSNMRDCVSVRDGMLMHNKILFARFSKPVGKFRGWVYVGSANLSESAWGKLVQDRTVKLPKLNCRNWECGVVMPVAISAPASEEGTRIIKDDLSIFDSVLQVPMVYPGDEYGQRKPWFFAG